MLSDLLRMLIMLGLSAAPRNLCATEEAWKNCEEAQKYERDMKEVGSLRLGVSEE